MKASGERGASSDRPMQQRCAVCLRSGLHPPLRHTMRTVPRRTHEHGCRNRGGAALVMETESIQADRSPGIMCGECVPTGLDATLEENRRAPGVPPSPDSPGVTPQSRRRTHRCVRLAAPIPSP